MDLFCGLGGFSRAFRERGHMVVGVDIVPPADVISDLSKGVPIRGRIDVLLASPPCTEFSRESMPWIRTGNAPSMELVDAAFGAIEDLKPSFWCVENVRGAVKWFKTAPTCRIGSRYLWTNILIPSIDHGVAYGKERLWPSKDRARLRSEIPKAISDAICYACEIYSK